MKKTFLHLLPLPLRRIARKFYYTLPLGVRMGKEYRALQDFLRDAQWWEKSRIATWQLQRVQRIVQYAYAHVPGYYSLYKNAGCAPQDLRTLADFKHLPFVDKAMLRDNLADFTSRAIPAHRRLYVATGGSSGEPLGFYHTPRNERMEAAFLHASFARSGWRPEQLTAVLRGAFLGTEKDFWRYDPEKRRLFLSSYNLHAGTYEKYRNKILEISPQHLSAYPSAAAILADLIMARGDQAKIKFQTLLLESENLYAWQKEKLRRAFPSARVFAAYGHTEQAVLAAMCEYSDEYHLWPFYGYTEIVNESGMETPEGESGEVIATSFWNEATPFIRYRTADIAEVGAPHCDKCGRQFQLLAKISGRRQEFIVTKSGRYISMTALNMHSAIFAHVRQFQFYQDTAGRVVFKIVRNENYDARDSKSIHGELKKKLGEDVELRLEFVEAIPKTPRGKQRFLEQKLELAYGD